MNTSTSPSTSKVLCIYHANCADGLGAAWAVHKVLGENVEFVAAKYGDLPPHISHGSQDRDVLIVDFSYPLATLRAMASEARSVLVIDHHKTAQEDLKAIPPFDYLGQSCSGQRLGITVQQFWENAGNLKRETGFSSLAAIFDMNRSGAGLTWDYLHPSQPRPRIIDLIEDRDLWGFKHDPETRAFHAVLTSYDITDLPEMFKKLDCWNFWQETDRRSGNWSRYVLELGSAIVRAQSRLVESIVSSSRRTMKIAGYTVPVANCPPQLASEAGNILCEPKMQNFSKYEDGSGRLPPAFSATYYDAFDGKRHFSLRSPPGGADVGQIARQMAKYLNEQFKYNSPIGGFVGGGHEHAAGFDAPLGWEGE